MRCARVASPITADSSCLLTPPPTLIFHHRNPSSLLAKTRAHIQDAYTHYILTHTHLSCFFLLIINLFAPPTPYTPHQGLLRTLPSPTPQSTVFFFCLRSLLSSSLGRLLSCFILVYSTHLLTAAPLLSTLFRISFPYSECRFSFN